MGKLVLERVGDAGEVQDKGARRNSEGNEEAGTGGRRCERERKSRIQERDVGEEGALFIRRARRDRARTQI